MTYVLLSLGQTGGVVLLAVAGVFLGRWFARLPNHAWLAGYVVPLLLVVMIVVPRWIPRAELTAPFKWIMADRTEFAVMALIGTTLFSVLLCRLTQRRQRTAIGVLMVCYTAYFSVLPFLMPALAYPFHARIETTIESNGVCLQSTVYNCGPAAAVTALHKLGIPAEESTLALRAHTTRFAGTPMDSLSSAMSAAYGVKCRTLYCTGLEDLVGKEPAIAVIDFGLMVDHYVVVLSITDHLITLGDPLVGIRIITPEEFEQEWRKLAIMIEKD